jgi:hypothetical protein
VQGEIEGRLRRLLAERGPEAPIAAGDRLVSITPTRSTIWDRDKTRAELKALGLSDAQADVAFSPTLGGVADALVAAQWKNPEKGGVKRKAQEIAATMPAEHGQSMDFGRKKKRAPKTKPTDAPTESTVTFGDAGDDAVGQGVPDTEE